MNEWQKGARLVLRKLIENGTVDELQGLKDTAEKLQKQEPGADVENLLQVLDAAIDKRQQEGST